MVLSARYYGERAEDGQRLLGLTYRLLGGLAALGSYHQQGGLPPAAAPLLSEVAALMDEAPGLSTQTYAERRSALEPRVAALEDSPLLQVQLCGILECLEGLTQPL